MQINNLLSRSLIFLLLFNIFFQSKALSQEVADSFEVGNISSNIEGIIVNEKSNKLYILDSVLENGFEQPVLKVVDLESKSLISSIDISSLDDFGVLISLTDTGEIFLDKNYLVLANGSNLIIIDSEKDTIINSFKLPGSASGLAIDQATGTTWISYLNNSQSISKITNLLGTEIETINLNLPNSAVGISDLFYNSDNKELIVLAGSRIFTLDTENNLGIKETTGLKKDILTGTLPAYNPSNNRIFSFSKGIFYVIDLNKKRILNKVNFKKITHNKNLKNTLIPPPSIDFSTNQVFIPAIGEKGLYVLSGQRSGSVKLLKGIEGFYIDTAQNKNTTYVVTDATTLEEPDNIKIKESKIKITVIKNQ